MPKNNDTFGLTSIRNQILFFSFLITLVPSLGVGWVISNMIHTTLEEKTEQELLDLSNNIDREISLWFKERSYDLHVFSNSFVIHENYNDYIKTVLDDDAKKTALPSQIRAIETYLSSLQKQFSEYNSFLLLDNEGKVVASSFNAEKNLDAKLPKDINRQIKDAQFFKGPIFFDMSSSVPFMMIGSPLFADDSEQHIGTLAIKVSLTAIKDLIYSTANNTNNSSSISVDLIHLPNARYFLSTNKDEDHTIPVFADDDILKSFRGSPSLHYYTNRYGNNMVGVFTKLEMAKWGLVLAENYDSVFSRVSETRSQNFLSICFLSLIIGLAAYFLTRQIIRPLNTLTQGAQKVANGDLSIRLPVEKNDEIGFATKVFNEMVEELNQSQAKLEKLATQDVLTQLNNRKQILSILRDRFEHYRRYKNTFSVLMIDIDHFKNVNDTYGHMAGDMVLNSIGKIFMDTLRSIDSAGRYGGEEFLVILTHSEDDEAQNVAERIRVAVADHDFLYKNQKIHVTLSIGIAKISVHDKDEMALIGRADQALYSAKENGRNRVSYQEEKN